MGRNELACMKCVLYLAASSLKALQQRSICARMQVSLQSSVFESAVVKVQGGQECDLTAEEHEALKRFITDNRHIASTVGTANSASWATATLD